MIILAVLAILVSVYSAAGILWSRFGKRIDRDARRAIRQIDRDLDAYELSLERTP